MSLVPNVVPLQSWALSPTSRGDSPTDLQPVGDTELLALEASDGTTVFIRSDALAVQLARGRPELIEADGTIDFTAFRDRGAAQRGIGTWVWRRVTTLRLAPDGITALAKAKAAELLGEKVEDLALAGASWAGAKALMWAIESSLAGEPGLYAWNGGALEATDRCVDASDPRLAGLSGPGGKRALVFVHGTGSNTLGGFGGFAGSASWGALQKQFDGRVFGFEHRTFSESPIDNALALAEVLPDGARLCVITHSRGGLVGDLLCLATDADVGGADFSELVDAYRRDPRPDELEAEAADPALAARREKVADEERRKLRKLGLTLRQKKLQIERYVRVAAPARGTALLSDNLDVFLSGLLAVVRKFGAWSAGAVAGAVATPAAGVAAKRIADQGLAMLARVVLEIADKRLQPQVVPGIEAMLPEAPMGMLLARANLRPDIRLGVIAGDIEGGGVVRRLGVMFTDWMLFDRADNDLVVDTASMYGGLAARGDARAIFVQGAEVNHFRYFRDDTRTRSTPLPEAIDRWLASEDPALLPEWTPLVPPEPAPTRAASRSGAAPTDILFYLPGIMGSHLAAAGDRIWLDPLDLVRGRLVRIASGTPGPVAADGLVDMAYGKLGDHLATTHDVRRFAYDWRLPIVALGAQLAVALEDALAERPGTPLRILAHSMGGLVVRAAFAAKPQLWSDIVASGGRLVMMGTPNAGSHLFVETLLGKSETIRTLKRVDLRHDMQEVLDIVAGFSGAIHLLPAPGFEDTGGPARYDYYQRQTWLELADLNDDFWYGRDLGGRPAQTDLDQASAFWNDPATLAWLGAHADRVSYVMGQAENTPCGIFEQKNDEDRSLGLVMLTTQEGDGSVTWKSSMLPGLRASQYWLMPADHMGLTSTPAYFGDIESLLLRGEAQKLGRRPESRGIGIGGRAVRLRKAGPPPPYPTDAELVARLLGGTGRAIAVARRRASPLKVGVRAMDIRFIDMPVLCGHYRGDPIAGPQATIDEHLLGGALTLRARLGLHSGDLGSASIVLMPRSDDQIRQGLGRGALVVGLGVMGQLSAHGVAETVRAGVLRFLMAAADRLAEEQKRAIAHGSATVSRSGLRLAALLIGSNSAAQLSMPDSVKALVLGVLRANRDFAEGTLERNGGSAMPPLQIGSLELVELFRDAAITAAHAVADLSTALADDLRLLEAEVEPDTELRLGEGVRDRLSLSGASDYWPRLIACDADRDESDCPAECFDIRIRRNIPADALQRLLQLYGKGGPDADGRPAAVPMPVALDLPPLIQYAERFKFQYLGEKARAETVVRQRQPGLIEKLIEETFQGSNNTVHEQNGFGHTLFQLLVPLEFKAATRKSKNLILIVDQATANIPWEMMEADGAPLVLRTRMVRQLASLRFRVDPSTSDRLTACVIADPATDGFFEQFGWQGAGAAPKPDRLAPLPGAAAEGARVAEVLEAAQYDVARVQSGAPSTAVFKALLARSHRVLVIAAHGVSGVRAADGTYRTGVVLSSGLVLSASEISTMESVPDLVFLSCCHLGKVGSGAGASHRLAYSLASELIDIGVRCVVAAGWEVDDDAAKTFSETFFEQMAMHGRSFADAIHAARKRAYVEHPGCNTWGAYQAYGDPLFRLKVGVAQERRDHPMYAPDELLQWLEGRRVGTSRPGAGARTVEERLKLEMEEVEGRLATVPPAWVLRPDVQYAMGCLFSEFGDAGFEAARTALLRAISAEGRHGIVPITAIEKLANCEARMAETLGSGSDPDQRVRALELIESAIERMRTLIAVSSERPGKRTGSAAPAAPAGAAANAERQGLLGSACKRYAAILARDPAATWATVEPAIRQARDAYRAGESAAVADANYNLLNRLQLDCLLDEDAKASLPALDEIRAAAERRFATDFDFWDAVAGGDCAVTRWLFDPLPVDSASAVEALAADYRDAMACAATARQFDSVVKQHRLLTMFLRKRNRAGDRIRAGVLEELAQRLTGITEPADAVPQDAAAAPGRKRPPAKGAAGVATGGGVAKRRVPRKQGATAKKAVGKRRA